MSEPAVLREIPTVNYEEAARQASKALGEGEEALQRRLESLAAFDPGSVQDNRYTRLSLDWASMPVAAPVQEAVPSPVEGVSALPAGANLLSARLKENPASREALHGGASKWDALVLGAWREGLSVVYRPGEKKAKADYAAFGEGAGLVLEPILAEVGEGAEAALFLHWKKGSDASLRLTLLTGVVGAGASLKLFVLHDEPAYPHVLSVNLRLGRDASAEMFGLWAGGAWTMVRERADLLEPGASWRETELVVLDKKEHFDWDTRVRHCANHTQSDVQAKSVLSGRSRAVLTGDIDMENEAAKGDARLESHVLLLSPGARADSIPGLEIKAMDLKASHAASVGRPDENQMLYLQSRGLDEAQARRLVVEGFLKSLAGRAPMAFVEKVVESALERKLGA